MLLDSLIDISWPKVNPITKVIEPSFFRNYSTGELSGRFSAFRQLCSMILNTGLSLLLTSVISLPYVIQIFAYTPVLVMPALMIIGSSLIISIAAGLVQKQVNRMSPGYAVRTNGIAFTMISGLQKIRSAGAEKRAFGKWADSYSKSAALTYNPPLFLKIHGTLL
jgi:ABC-type bacteriocin/lantibiotic exporter with double-glycine peptidase domain